MTRRGSVAILLVAAGALAALSATSGRLAPPHYRLEPSSATVPEKGTFTLAIVPGRDPGTIPPHDLYVSFVPDAGRTWAFLSPAGAWSATAQVYREVRSTPARPLTIRFEGVEPAAWYTFRVQTVVPGAPATRKHYLAQPATVRVRVKAPLTADHGMTLGALGLAAGAAILIVSLYPRGAHPAAPGDETCHPGCQNQPPEDPQPA